MPKFLTVHKESRIDKVTLESRWTEIAKDPRADWQMTLFNMEPGKRFCEWDAPDRETIETIFRELGIKWSEIIEVDVTTASEWRIWQLETGKGTKRCWEVMDCGREPELSIDGDLGLCPAAVDPSPRERRADLFAGRYCWKVVGARCREKVAGTFYEHLIDSSACPFFEQADQSGGPRFEM